MGQIKVFSNIGELLTLKSAFKKQGRNIVEKDLSIIKKGAMITENGKILWVGRETKINSTLIDKVGLKKKVQEIDCGGRTLMPSFTECHTHLVYGGDRSAEFELRNQGISYQEIARRGGGILSTMKETRKASFEDLLEVSQLRVNRFIEQGVTTVEVKSGYALDEKNELKMLRVARALKKAKIISTFLGLHAVPEGFSSSDEYTSYVVKKVLPLVASEKLADRVDVFIEKGYFSIKDADRLFAKSYELGLGVMAHTEQLNKTGGFSSVIKYNGQSADHLVQLSKKQSGVLAESNVTAVLLPAADLYLKMAYPDARSLLDQGGRVAIATDYNPGSSPTQDLSLVGLLSRLEMKMTLAEVLVGYTLSASWSLGLQNEQGSLDVGKNADFILLNDDWDKFFYSVGYHPVHEAWRHGKRVFRK